MSPQNKTTYRCLYIMGAEISILLCAGLHSLFICILKYCIASANITHRGLQLIKSFSQDSKICLSWGTAMHCNVPGQCKKNQYNTKQRCWHWLDAVHCTACCSVAWTELQVSMAHLPCYSCICSKQAGSWNSHNLQVFLNIGQKMSMYSNEVSVS